jgi:protease-4
MSVGSVLAGVFGVVWRVLEGIRKFLHLILLLVIFGFVLAALHSATPAVPRTAALVVAPEGVLVEQLSIDPVRRAFGEASGEPAPETLLKDVIDAIGYAKNDSRIKLIVLDVGMLAPSGLSKLQEIGAALRDFRSAGKRVVVAADSMDQTQYYLAAQAGEVYLDPFGLVYVDGFSYYRMFLKEAIDKLAVDVNVFRAGTFKSYTDEYSRSDMAPSERQETSVWLNALWKAYAQDVTRARSLPENALDDFIGDEPAALAAVNGDAARLALQKGLVTALKTRRQLADEVKGLVGEDTDTHSFNSIDVAPYVSASSSRPARSSMVISRPEPSVARAPPICCARRATIRPSNPWCCASTARAAACSPPSKSCARSRHCARRASRWWSR